MYALWRSCQHYAAANSLPDAQASSLDRLLGEASRLPTVGRRQQFVAKSRGGEWTAAGFVKDGSLRVTDNVPRYDRIRRGKEKWSNDSYPPLKPSDHPQRTIDLG